MARSLNLEEAEVFSQDILAAQKFPLINDSTKSQLKRRDNTLELTAELTRWFGDQFSGYWGF